MSYDPADVPRVPDELLAADIPDWAMRVWLAVRKVQGGNGWAWASRTRYAAICNKDRAMVTHAIQALIEAGWIEAGEGKNLRCHIGQAVVANRYAKAVRTGKSADAAEPTECEQDSTFPPGQKCEQDSRKCEQDSRKCEQDSPPSESSQESSQEPSHGGPAAPESAECVGEADPLGFDAFWEAYGRKEKRRDCKRHWDGLSRRKRAAIMAHVPAFVAATPDVQFRPHPLTYLHGKRWEDEALPPPREPARQPVDLSGMLLPADVARAVAESRGALTAADFVVASTDNRTGLDLSRLSSSARRRLAGEVGTAEAVPAASIPA